MARHGPASKQRCLTINFILMCIYIAALGVIGYYVESIDHPVRIIAVIAAFAFWSGVYIIKEADE